MALDEEAGPPEAWWRSAVMYQVYPRSFADGNGDGEGDLPGLRAKLPYLADLGVDGLWISPWFPSPMADGGYDVSDFRDIHPMFGTLDDADAVLREARELGLRVIIDLVPNHTSDQHPWFLDALAAGAGFGRAGPLLLPRRPRRVRRGAAEQLDQRLRRAGLGAGHRARRRTGAVVPAPLRARAARPRLDQRGGARRLRRRAAVLVRPRGGRAPDRRGARRCRRRPGCRTPTTAGCCSSAPSTGTTTRTGTSTRCTTSSGAGGRSPTPTTATGRSSPRPWSARRSGWPNYLRPDEMHTAFNFPYLKGPWEAGPLRQVIDDTLSSFAPIGVPSTWVLTSHDEIRPVTRYGRATTSSYFISDGAGEVSDLALGTRRARAAAMLMLALPGGAYVYQGEELGLPNVDDLPDEVLQDPMFLRSGGEMRGRDGCRVPLPWSGQAPPFGFSPDGVDAVVAAARRRGAT